MTKQIRTVWQGLAPAAVVKRKMQITDDPIEGRMTHTDCYKLFNQMKIGQCIVCDSKDVNALANAMRRWAVKHKKDIKPKIKINCADGAGRVWMITEQDSGK